MTPLKSVRVVFAVAVTVWCAVAITGCGDGDGNAAVRDEVKKAGVTSEGGSGAFGKVATDTKAPPQGKPPEPGTDFSTRGNAAAVNSAPSAP